MNVSNFAGRLGRDAELRDANGTPVANFALAVDDYKNGEKFTMWIDCSIWKERAEKLAPYLLKGTAVAVSGRVGLRQFEKRDGSPGASLTLMVNSVTLLGSKPDGATASNGVGHDWKAAEAKAKAEMPANRVPASNELNDDIPFSFAYALPAGLLAWAMFAASAVQGVIA